MMKETVGGPGGYSPHRTEWTRRDLKSRVFRGLKTSRGLLAANQALLKWMRNCTGILPTELRAHR